MFLRYVCLKNTRFNHNLLMIPGPVTTSKTVKYEVAKDNGSRDDSFVERIKYIRKNILKLVNANNKNYSTVLMQGSGTFANESVLGSLPNNTYLGVFSNGIYGDRLYDIAKTLNIKSEIINFDHAKQINKEMVEPYIKKFSHIAMVHNETTLGTLNDIENIAKLTKKNNKVFIVDAISSMGGIPIDIENTNIDYLIGTSNKCLHSFPGLSIIVGKKSLLQEYKTSKSLSLNLYDQWMEFEKTNQFRYTPPVQIVNSLHASICELLSDGGVEARHKKYKKFNEIVRYEIEKFGMKSIVDKSSQGPIVSSFYYPYKNFSYKELYKRLLKHNIIIYTAQYKNEDVLRLGNIGHINENELYYILEKIKQEISSM